MARLAILGLIFLVLCGFSRVPSSALFRAEALAGIAVEQAAAGELAEAGETLSLARDAADQLSGEDRGEALGQIAWAEASMGDPAAALDTAESIEALDDRVLALCRITLVRAKAGDESRARHTAGLVLKELQQEPKGATDLVVPAAPAILGLFGQAPGALALANEITDPEDRMLFLLGLAVGRAEAGDKTGARQIAAQVAEAMRHLDKPMTEVEPLLAWIWAKTDEPDHAFEAAKGLAKPVLRAMGIGLLATVQAEEGDARGARETAARALAELDEIPADSGEDDREMADAAAFARSAVAVAQAAAGDLQDGIRVAEGEPLNGLRAWNLATLGAARAASGDQVGARQVLSAAGDLARNVEDLENRTQALFAVLLAQVELGDSESVRTTLAALDDVQESELSIPVFAMSWARLLGGDALGALELTVNYDMPIFRSDWGRPAATIAWAQARIGAFAAALETATHIYDSRDRDSLLSRADRLQSKMGDLAGAVETALSIEDPRWRSRSLSDLAQAQVRAGEGEAAAATFAGAVAAAGRVEGTSWTSATHERALAIAGIARDRARAGDLEGAEATFTEALAVAQTIADPEDRAKVESEIEQSRAAARNAKSDMAEADNASASEPSAAPEEPALDRAAAEALTDPLARVRALGALARWQAAEGDAAGAGEVAARARETARAIRLAPLRALALLDVAGALEAAGDRAGARQVLDLLARTAEGLSSPRDRGQSLVSVAEMLADWGDVAGARQAIPSAISAARQMKTSR